MKKPVFRAVSEWSIFKRLSLIFVFGLISSVIFSQSYKIKGKVFSDAREPLGFAVIRLISQDDSSRFFSTITSEEGKYQIEGISEGNYRMDVSFIGFETRNRTLNIPADGLEYDFELSYSAAELPGAEIRHELNPVEFKLDKQVVNLKENNLNSGETAADLLKVIP